MTSSTGESGLIFAGSPPRARIASRIAARSTTAGTPVKSWSRTREGVKAISVEGSAAASHPASAATSLAVTSIPSSWRSRFSRRIFSGEGQAAQVESIGEPIEPEDLVLRAADLEASSAC